MAICIKDAIQSLNIVIGCNIGCEYCYARGSARRYKMTRDFSVPEYFPGKLALLDRPRPRNLMLTGMSDLSLWQDSWLDEVLRDMNRNPQHRYVFLTKRPRRISVPAAPDSAWFGVTVTSSSEKWRIAALRERVQGGHMHVTFEPMFDDIGEVDLDGVEWIVVGTETGRRRGKSTSRSEWVWSLTNQAHARGIPVFMKEDLLPIIGDENMVQELPPAFVRVLEAQAKWQK